MKAKQSEDLDADLRQHTHLHQTRDGKRATAMIAAALLLTFGAYYSKDTVAANSHAIQERFHLTKTQYGALYGLSGVPSIFMSLVGGSIVDKMGAASSALLFAVVVLLGSMMLAMAPYFNVVSLLAAGQLMQGLAKASLITAQKVFLREAGAPTNRTGKLYALSFSISHAGTFAVFLVSPLLTRACGLEASLWLGAATCLASSLCAMLLLLGTRRTRRLHRNTHRCPSHLEGASVLKRACYYVQGLVKLGFFLTMATALCFYTAFFPSLAFARDFLTTTHGVTGHTAAIITSLLTVVSVVLGPVFGALVDKGFRGRFLHRGSIISSAFSVQLCGMLMAFGGYALLIGGKKEDLATPGSSSSSSAAWPLGLALLALSFAVVPSAVWPAFTVWVPTGSLGLAFGVTHAVDDTAQMVMSTLIGHTLDRGGTYQASVLPILTFMSAAGVISTLGLMCMKVSTVQAQTENGMYQHLSSSGRTYSALLGMDGTASTDDAGDVTMGDVEGEGKVSLPDEDSECAAVTRLTESDEDFHSRSWGTGIKE